jgi:transposase
MHDNIIQLLFLDSIKNSIEHLETYRIDDQLVIDVTLKKSDLKCHICQDQMKFHSYRLKQIHYGISSFEAYHIKYHSRRYKCPTCGKYQSEINPFGERNKNISRLTKHAILADLKTPQRTFNDIAKQYHVSSQTVLRIFDQAVDAPRLQLGRTICMDEVFISKRRKSPYACVLYDFDSRQIIDVMPTRHKHYLQQYFLCIPIHEKDRVNVFIIDMWESYKDVLEKAFPKALIAVDSFHVIANLNRAMDSVRIDTMNKFKLERSKLLNNDMYYYMLKKFHFFFKIDLDRLRDFKPAFIAKLNTYWDKQTILRYLLDIDDTLALCFKLKEKYRYFNLTAEYDTCDEALDELIDEFKSNPIKEFRDFGRMLQNWKVEIKNSFIMSKGRRISNGPIESTNSKIKTIIKASNGIRDFRRLRNKIMYSINKDTPLKN